MPKACIFCGSTESKITREHVIPEWIANLFPEEEQMTYGIVQADGSIKDFQARPFQQTVNVVCATCNAGWMSALEAAVQPRLGPMIQSARITHLTPQTQRTVATWAVKTALMMEYLHPAPRIIPESEYPSLYAEQQPSQRHLVFLSRWNPDIGSSRKALVISRTNRVNEFSIAHRPTDEGREEAKRVAEAFANKTYTLFHVMFAIGYVAFAVIGHNSPMTFRFSAPPQFLDIAQRIWPMEHAITWPPRRILGDTSPLRDFFSASDKKTEQESPP